MSSLYLWGCWMESCHFHFLKSTAICNICVVLKWFQLFSLSFILVGFWEGHFWASTDQWSKTSSDQMWTFWFLAASLCLFVELKRLPRPAGTMQGLTPSSSKYFLLLRTWRNTCFPPSSWHLYLFPPSSASLKSPLGRMVVNTSHDKRKSC